MAGWQRINCNVDIENGMVEEKEKEERNRGDLVPYFVQRNGRPTVTTTGGSTCQLRVLGHAHNDAKHVRNGVFEIHQHLPTTSRECLCSSVSVGADPRFSASSRTPQRCCTSQPVRGFRYPWSVQSNPSLNTTVSTSQF